VAVLAAVVAVGTSTVAQAKDKRELTVMTQNLYLGSDLAPAINAANPVEFLVGVATIYGTVQFTDFPDRAKTIADEIQANAPDVVSLQEVSNWITSGPTTSPSLDFLAILQTELANRGLDYSVAATSNNANIGPVPLVAPCSVAILGACLLTFQDRDVILVNRNNPSLRVTASNSGRYATQEILTTAVGSLSFDRGWATIDGKFEGKKFHLANTHLETEAYPAVQQAQGREFLAGPARSGGAVIATGDFNSAADGSTTTTYASLTKSYFDDSWNTNPGDPGLSCCQNGTLTNTASLFTSRIDLVLTHGAARALDAHLIGNVPFQVLPFPNPPFWPSDHAGLIATVRVH
jgi:endonuclease/exonuclease/phosphatase family metal-dependent hydrolase